MKQITGSPGVSLLACVNPKRDKWSVRWNVSDEADGLVTYMEQEFAYRPALEETISLIKSWYNERTRQRIISGHCWKGDLVWLSTENQYNYKSEYDLAIQSSGESLPVTFKLGTDEQPMYHTFRSVDEIKEFYISIITHIRMVQKEGWMHKDSINREDYEGK